MSIRENYCVEYLQGYNFTEIWNSVKTLGCTMFNGRAGLLLN